VCGTHVMGSIPRASVVNYRQQSWDHSNLYIVGCGSMPSISSQNPTLTMLAITSLTVDHILSRV
jgi:glucose dehydrogenase